MSTLATLDAASLGRRSARDAQEVQVGGGGRRCFRGGAAGTRPVRPRLVSRQAQRTYLTCSL
jgi:hypothetical protein